MRYIWAVAAALNTLLLVWLVWRLPAPDGAPKISYDQFISISLTIMTVVLGVVALLMAYLAFEGKNQVIEKAREIAAEEFRKAKPELFDQLRQDANGLLQQLVQQEGNLIYEDLATTHGGKASNFDPADIPDDLEEVNRV